MGGETDPHLLHHGSTLTTPRIHTTPHLRICPVHRLVWNCKGADHHLLASPAAAQPRSPFPSDATCCPGPLSPQMQPAAQVPIPQMPPAAQVPFPQMQPAAQVPFPLRCNLLPRSPFLSEATCCRLTLFCSNPLFLISWPPLPFAAHCPPPRRFPRRPLPSYPVPP